MTIRNVFVPLNGSTATSPSLDTALLVAKAFRAHAEILFVREGFQVALHHAALAEGGFAAQEFVDSHEREQSKGEKLARHRFDELLERHRIDYRENSLPAELPSAYWRVKEGWAAEEIEQRGAAAYFREEQGIADSQ